MDYLPRKQGSTNIALPEPRMPKVLPEGELKTYKVDASRWGMSGLMARLKPSMHAKPANAQGLTNGATVQGKYSFSHPGWVQLQDGSWLPVMQRGHNVLRETPSAPGASSSQ